METKIINNICKKYNLGSLIRSPLPLNGGFLHKVYALFTEKGKYALKLLNPLIMRRDTAMENFRRAEELESILENSKIPIVSALLLEGRKLQKIDNRYFYVYNFFDGKTLTSDEIKEAHCQKIGSILAQIHQLGRHEEQNVRNEIHVDLDCYIDKLASEKQELCQLLKVNRSILYECQTNGNLAIKKLPRVVCVCHNDMDTKNVLWQESDCKIIDLESLDYSSPYIELYELALCWSGYEKCNIDFELYRSFLRAYVEAGGELLNDSEVIIYLSQFGRLEWLEYNIKRSLGIECAPHEIDVATAEVKNTIKQIVYYHNIKDKLISCLRTV